MYILYSVHVLHGIKKKNSVLMPHGSSRDPRHQTQQFLGFELLTWTLSALIKSFVPELNILLPCFGLSAMYYTLPDPARIHSTAVHNTCP